jgi:hypothetical protein
MSALGGSVNFSPPEATGAEAGDGAEAANVREAFGVPEAAEVAKAGEVGEALDASDAVASGDVPPATASRVAGCGCRPAPYLPASGPRVPAKACAAVSAGIGCAGARGRVSSIARGVRAGGGPALPVRAARDAFGCGTTACKASLGGVAAALDGEWGEAARGASPTTVAARSCVAKSIGRGVSTATWTGISLGVGAGFSPGTRSSHTPTSAWTSNTSARAMTQRVAGPRACRRHGWPATIVRGRRGAAREDKSAMDFQAGGHYALRARSYPSS